MDATGSFRLIWVHRWSILLLSAVGGFLVAGLVTLLPPTYSSTAVLRVSPPTGTLDAVVLNTAVNWYVGLGQVPVVLRNAGNAVSPQLSESQVESRTRLAAAAGPGEITVTATGPDTDSAQDLADAMSRAVLTLVEGDAQQRIGGTTLRLLVPADPGAVSGRSALTLGVATSLLLLVVAATLVAVFGRRVNWRLSAAAATELADYLRIPAYRVAASPTEVGPRTISAGAALAPVVTGRSVTVVPMSPTRAGVQGGRVVGEALSRLGVVVPVVECGSSTTAVEGPAVYTVVQTGSPAIAMAVRMGAPVAVALVRHSRSRAVMRLVEDLGAIGLDVVAILLLGTDRRGSDDEDHTVHLDDRLGLS